MPPLEENEYEVLWDRGVLGVIFLASEKDGLIRGKIHRVVHLAPDRAGILATMKKPVLVRFERPSKSRPPSLDASGSSGSSELLEQPSTSSNDMGGAKATMKEANGDSNGNGGGSGSNSSAMDKKRATWADRVREKMPPLEENEYEVLWERGVLGVSFHGSKKDGTPYVSQITESCISPQIALGDIFKSGDVVRSKDHSFYDFFKILATMTKPMLVRFERPPKSRLPSLEPRQLWKQ